VVPWTSAHSLPTQPSSNSAKSFISLGSNKESIIVGSIGVLVLLLIIVSVIFVSIYKCRDQKISTSAGSTYSSHGISYRQLLRDSDQVHEQTSRSTSISWTTRCSPETNGPHQGGLMNCPPPPYHTVVTLTQPSDECNSTTGTVHDVYLTDSEAPPPYPGS
jgi:hypothetical protein